MAEAYEIVAQFLLQRTACRPEVGIICGSGLSGLSKSLSNTQTFKYEDIPGFPEATVPGHAGELVFGTIGDVQAVCMRGRFHFYEGNNMEKVVLPVRVMRLMGVKLLIVTNAAGGLNDAYNVGDIMVIQDHIGLPCMAGFTPLRGINDNQLGPRFPAMSDAYDGELQDIVLKAADTLGFAKKVHANGTYCFLSGPCYESRAECRMLKNWGVDCVGMSTVPEVMTAKHCGMKVLGLSIVTNKVVFNKEDTNHANHEEVLEAVEMTGKDVESIVKFIVAQGGLKQYIARLPNFVYETGKSTAHGHVKAVDNKMTTPPPAAAPVCACCVQGGCNKSSSSSTAAAVSVGGLVVSALVGALVALFVVRRHGH